VFCSIHPFCVFVSGFILKIWDLFREDYCLQNRRKEVKYCSGSGIQAREADKSLLVIIEFHNDTKNIVVLDVSPCGSCKNRRIGGACRLHYQDDNNRRPGSSVSIRNRSTLRILSYCQWSLIFDTLMEAIRSS
jgi:hypothetical protein